MRIDLTQTPLARDALATFCLCSMSKDKLRKELMGGLLIDLHRATNEYLQCKATQEGAFCTEEGALQTGGSRRI
jgi:hypothetical protein